MQNNNLINAKVVYKDINTNKTVYTRGVTGHSKDPISLKQYKKYVPNNYQFEGYGHFSPYLKANDTEVIFVKPRQNSSAAVSKNGKILVNYINAEDQLINRNQFTNHVGSSFNMSLCKSTIPKNYKFDRILMGRNVKIFKAQTQMIVVRVSKIHDAKILIKYMDQKDQQVGQANAKGAVGTKFQIDQYVQNVPKGYRFLNIIGLIPQKFQKDQTIKINVAKIARPQTAPSTSQASSPHKRNSSHDQNRTSYNQYDSEQIGKILMKLATSLHALGETIRNSRNL